MYDDFYESIAKVQRLYDIGNFIDESNAWYQMWKARSPNTTEMSLCDLLLYTYFDPAIRQAILILMTLLAISCTVERPFSTMRRVKTWLRLDDVGQQITIIVPAQCPPKIYRRK